MPKKNSEAKVVTEGRTILVEYTGKLDDGTVFDKSNGKPLEFVVGEHKILPAFEKAVTGMKKGESKTIKLTPSEGYGECHSELIRDIPRDLVPKEMDIKKGMMLMLGSPDGRRIPATIADVTDEKVVVDLNHPLAGKNLTFDIKVVSIK
jgi:peptidylprolyl isomerase